MMIGSPAAAGGCSLVAADKEETRKEEATTEARKEYETRTLSRRWMDDLSSVKEEELGVEATEMAKDMESSKFFGKMRKTIQVGGDEGFGFKFEIRGTKLIVKPILKFVKKKEEEDVRKEECSRGWEEKTGAIHGGPQFRPDRTDRSVGTGYLYRWLDLNNLPEEEAVKGVTRIVLELDKAMYPKKTVMRILKKARMEVRCNLEEAVAALDWPKDEKRRWVEEYDERNG